MRLYSLYIVRQTLCCCAEVWRPRGPRFCGSDLLPTCLFSASCISQWCAHVFAVPCPQVDIYEFEKTELNSQEEMEKQARLYAEEQLQEAKMALQCERQAKAELQGQIKAKMQEFAGLLEEATQKHTQEKERNAALQQQLEQVRGVPARCFGSGLLGAAHLHAQMQQQGNPSCAPLHAACAHKRG